MDTLKKLEQKHERSAAAPGLAIESIDVAGDGSQSTTVSVPDPVKKLTDYLKTCDGIQLMIIDGRPALHFVSGLRPEQTERWSQAQRAMELIWKARDRLYYLIDKRLINLPSRGSFR